MMLAEVEVAMKPNLGQLWRYLTIQVTESHESTLIRRFLTPMNRAQAFLVSIEGKRVLQLANLVNARLLFVLESTLL